MKNVPREIFEKKKEPKKNKTGKAKIEKKKRN